jgi:REP element-mobilizing transposase RayT
VARPLRIEFVGAVYHVMARGNEQRAIFRGDADRRRFLETLAEAVGQFGLRLHAYCLMPNHYHLVIGTPQGNLSRSIGWLQATYTARFNARHRRRGHLFQGRFKAQLVDADSYGRWLVEYVHLNPVRPRRKQDPISPERFPEWNAYRWSSHRVYAGLSRSPGDWLSLDWLRYWGRTPRTARQEYRRIMRQAFGHSVRNPWEDLRRGLVLGGEELWQRTEALVRQKNGLEEARWSAQRQTERVRERVQALLVGEPDERIRIWARVRLGNERGMDVARAYGGRSSSAVTMTVRRLEERATHEKGLRQKLERLRQETKCEM